MKSYAKKTYQTKAAQLVPVSAARCHSIYKYFRRQTIEKNEQETKSSKKTPHTPTPQKRA